MTAKGIIRITCIVLLQFTLFSCHSEEEVAPAEETMPLKVGNYWTYQVSDYDSEGNVVGTSSYTRAVVKDTVINGGKWYILNNGSIVQNNQSGYVYFNKFNRPGDEAVMIYQNASTGGIGYMYTYPNYELWVLTTRTYELAPFVTSLGNFSCYTFTVERQYKQPGSSSASSTFQKDYVSPSVGLVRSDRLYAGSEDLMRREELVSYHVQ